MTVDATTAAPPAPARRWATARPQLGVMAAQWAAGVGNLAFAVVLARVLPTSEYSNMAAFLGVYVLLSVPGAALSAAGALNPAQLEALSARIVAVGVAAGVGLVATAAPLARLLNVPAGLLVALGIAAPAAALLGARRGVAYGRRRHRHVAASLVAEPLVRLTVGIALAARFGAVGAAAATAAAGYAAGLAVGTTPPDARGEDEADDGTVLRLRTAGLARALLPAAAPFALVAVLQTADLLVADRVLGRSPAAEFGVLSTIGGAAVFATATVPLVLLPALRSTGAERSGTDPSPARGSAATTATVITIGVGGLIAVAGALAARPFVELTFGERYADVAPLVGPYLAAMALVAAIRVRLARLVADDHARFAATAVAVAVAAEVVLVALVADGPGDVVAVTLATTAALTAVVELWPRARGVAVPGDPGLLGRLAEPLRRDRSRVAGLVGLGAVAAAVRLATSRGLWVDEAISVRQAQLPWGEMLADMRFTDVHPPAHHALLWVTVRVFGTSELAVRVPSLLAGIALVPAMFWVGRLLYDRRTGWVAAAMAAVAPFCVWYSQEARMYAQFMLIAVLAVGTQVQAIRRGLRRDWVLYGLCTAALVWTQYFAVLPILVQQAAFAAVAWSRRHDRRQRRRLLLGWAGSTLVVAVALAPMLPLLADQLAAYRNRGAGLVPGQAGAGNSSFGGAVSIYALGANLIWALLGYHADGVMVQLAALWPLLMLVVLVLLGRGRSKVSLLLAALIVVPLGALFAIGSIKRDLFELRYFSGAVPAMLLLTARFVTATTRRRAVAAVTATVVVGAMTVGLVDQQLNGANPRLYDFEGAFRRIEAEAGPDDVVLYEPSYLAEVVEYYAPDLDSRPVGAEVPNDARVWVVSTDRIVNTEASAAALGGVLSDLQQHRDLVDRFGVPNVRVWELSPTGPLTKQFDERFGK